jgi:hypothetical protein
MNKEQAEHLIKILEAIKTRPGIYIGDGYIPEKIRMLLIGMGLITYHIMGVDPKPYREIIYRHGWGNDPEGLIPEMRRAGLSDQEIVTQLVDLEIELYKQGYGLE